MAPISVLLVDDEPLVHHSLRTLLERNPDLRVCGTAENPSDAGEKARAEQPDVAVVDVKMPGGGGPQAIREIARRSPTTKVVALSAAEDRDAVLAMLKAGAVGYTTKAERPDAVLEAIRDAAAGRASISNHVAATLIDELSDKLRTDESEDRSLRQARSRIVSILQNGGCRAVFQPIVRLSTNRIVGVEAFARFDAPPARAPDVWFAEAAAAGLGAELELFAARNALREATVLPDSWFLAINFSPETLLGSGLLHILDLAQGRTVVAEVTEHTPIENYDALVTALRLFREKGGLLAVDDAGAGFASLRHILRLSPELIKIDISLSRNIHVDENKRALATALVSYGRESGAAVLVEGIENQAELDTLRSIGATYGQGYYWSRPCPVTDLKEER